MKRECRREFEASEISIVGLNGKIETDTEIREVFVVCFNGLLASLLMLNFENEYLGSTWGQLGDDNHVIKT